ncbi:Ccc1 family [Lasiosphaeria ovina]|uniref:Ccc1 family n=1 Tax=Lasiosphaeria ovina TaxID=92902 RepID=A0AAE0KHI6_9PEZI|nr:Ccc1 family [Lasiosphaeria ovina]
MKRFLADFTLGFADGLTVPFALTAGLSSLGETSTVIYAGMAEICAGSISMGIGGYLAARGSGESQAPETLCSSGNSSHSDDDAEKHPLYSAPQGAEHIDSAADAARAAVVEHLAPLRLPRHLVETAWAHVQEDLQSGGGAEDSAAVLVAALSRRNQSAHPDEDEPAASGSYSSVLAGLSVSAGYLTGGSLPLFPYFFVASVDDGLLWSFLVCVAALFMFGFAKHYLLSEANAGNGGSRVAGRAALTVDWRRLRGGVWEGLQMVVLGSLAALAAVLCVRLFSGLV